MVVVDVVFVLVVDLVVVDELFIVVVDLVVVDDVFAARIWYLPTLFSNAEVEVEAEAESRAADRSGISPT